VRELGSGTRQTFDRAMRGLLPSSTSPWPCSTPRPSRGRSRRPGLGCISRIALEDAFRHGTLKRCRVPHRDFRRQFFFLLHKQKFRSAGIQRWLALCRESGGEIE
jgi:hypothetical protein